MKSGDAPAFPNITDQPVEHVGVGEDRADDAVQKYCVVLFDVRVLQVVEIVVEDRLVGACISGDQLQHQVPVGDGRVVEPAGGT